ncbi:MAG: integration host factor subunit beta [Planctomycetota bacterium]|jgi:nucleoid DNA-binding protein|nr:integration host factor subunit beta [Planctomycetota bacterium]
MKSDIVLKIAKEMNLRQGEVKCVVQMTLDGIIDILVKEGRLELRNFGIFVVKTRKPRKARNPRTGREVEVEERKSIAFKGGKSMLDRANAVAVPLPETSR